MQTEQRTALYDAVETKAADTRNFEFAFAQRQRRQGLMLQVPIGLVVSSDQEARRQRREKLSPTTALDKPSRVPLPRYAPRSGYHHKIHPGQSNPSFPAELDACSSQSARTACFPLVNLHIDTLCECH